jgi:hypothetical protein
MPQVVDRTKRTPEREERLLQVLATGASVYKAALAAGIGRTTAYEWRENDPDFRARWDEAVENGIDLMEDEALRRAVNGTDKPVFYQGEVCGEVKEYSDTLMIFQLKARRPEKYRERTDTNVTGTINVTITTYAPPMIEGAAETVKLIGESE